MGGTYMTILVLGSEGVIGSSLCKYLESCGHEIIRWDIKLTNDHDLSNSLNIYKLKNAIDESDFVYFLAYDVGGAKYIWDVDLDFINRNNMIMINTFNLLKDKKFIFASSTMFNMDNVYGTLKYMGEHYTRKLGGLSARFWNVYGPENVSEKSHVITDMIHKYKANGYIDLMTDGEEERQFLHTDDCAKCLTIVMDNYEDIRLKTDSVDITSFETNKIIDVAKFICDDVRPSAKNMNTHDKFNEPREFILHYWKPEITLKEGIASLQ
ncbi:MAG: NAD-dependent epimerase/dehydratase [Dehalococcoidia bacterium]|nr:NAD-dependent epimerase/dehydratase [Dehalococcoidia bacterium]|tara:strand:- start:15031 stop:15831 length:801 start_codon:yes stop_codon:yes gene_type:complete